MPRQAKGLFRSCDVNLSLWHAQPNESMRLEVRLQDDTVWLTQQQMTELFKTTKQNVSLHINNIFREGELTQDSVVKESLTTGTGGRVPCSQKN